MAEIPEDVVEEAKRLTRLARNAVDDAETAAYRDHRDELVGEHGFTARVREDTASATLVLYPAEWVEGGTVALDEVQDLSRAVEVHIEGAENPDDWHAVEEHNRALAAAVREAHGDIHGDNAAAFAAFMSNHYGRAMETASAGEIAEFLTEFFPRNAWPSDEQKSVVERSVELVFDVADEPAPSI